MKLTLLSKALITTLLSTLLLTGCLEEKKKDEASVTDGTGGDGGGGTTPTYTCDEASSGFRPLENASFATGLTPGATINSISYYFFESTSGNLGSSQIKVTATSCTLGGATLATSTVTVVTSMVSNRVKKTFTFSSPFTVPDCGSGVGTVGFLFTGSTINNSSTTFFVGAQKTANSSCNATVTVDTNSMSPHSGLYSYSGEIL